MSVQFSFLNEKENGIVNFIEDNANKTVRTTLVIFEKKNLIN